MGLSQSDIFYRGAGGGRGGRGGEDKVITINIKKYLENFLVSRTTRIRDFCKWLLMPVANIENILKDSRMVCNVSVTVNY